MKVGFEIHILQNYKKIFCKCVFHKDCKLKSEITLKNFQRRVGELSKLEKDTEYQYTFCQECACDYELQEQFREKRRIPFATRYYLTKEKVRLPEKIVFCRKEISDGSILSGFQRSAYLGTKSIYLGKKKIKLSLYFEEDACKKEDLKSYSLNRQGLRLMEITTTPIKIENISQISEILQQIALKFYSRILLPKESFSIRQDINISWKKNSRVELKGINKLTPIPEIIRKESLRQKEIINSIRPFIVNIRKKTIYSKNNFFIEYLLKFSREKKNNTYYFEEHHFHYLTNYLKKIRKGYFNETRGVVNETDSKFNRLILKSKEKMVMEGDVNPIDKSEFILSKKIKCLEELVDKSILGPICALEEKDMLLEKILFLKKDEAKMFLNTYLRKRHSYVRESGVKAYFQAYSRCFNAFLMQKEEESLSRYIYENIKLHYGKY